MLRRSFAAMGTEVELFLDADESAASLLDDGERELRRLEDLLSRFRPDSELSRLNRAGALRVGPELLELARLSLEARACTAGRFDPTVHDALAAAGYDRSFELLEEDRPGAPRGGAPCGGGITVDAATSTVALEHGFRLDLGGIAKGWAVDRVLSLLREGGPSLVNAGGDVAAAGRPWPVGVETPAASITLELDGGALATSGRDRRTWRRGGREHHHLVDPSTGLPAAGDLLRVTAAAPTAADAEVLAKALFLAGDAGRAAAEADEGGVPAVLVSCDGTTTLAGGLG